MATAVVRVDETTHARLRKLSNAEKRPIGQIVNDLVARYEDERFWKTFHDDFARLRADQAAWADYQREAQAWLASDSLANEEPYFAEGEFEAEIARRANDTES